MERKKMKEEKSIAGQNVEHEKAAFYVFHAHPLIFSHKMIV
jgi:hypothetical protein